ncbi:MAG: hypothetical protein BMS9Abin09_0320 [Gammaproteobacteria bacterium]|nr:MAG: hypothetical protein BMS9Abin09_0320 [Gammaproteobacteria bacterium]
MWFSFARFVLLSVLAVLLSACGGGGGSSSGSTVAPATLLSGTAATGAAIRGFVYVRDSSGNEVNVPTSAGGEFSVDISGMDPPFLLQAIPDDGRAVQYSYGVGKDIIVNVTPLTTLALLLASGNTDLAAMYNNWGIQNIRVSQQTGAQLPLTLQAVLNAQAFIFENLKAQFEARGINTDSYDLFGTRFEADGTGIDGVLDDLEFVYDYSERSFVILDRLSNVVVYDLAADTGTVPADGGTVTDIPVSSAPPGSAVVANTIPSNYAWDTLAAGKLLYIDRNYKYLSIPALYQGLTYLQTSNDAKLSVGDAVINFDVTGEATVYVAHTAAASARPAWLQSWQATGDVLDTSDRALYVYAKDFTPGRVALGGNEGSPSMYTVLVATARNGATGGGTTGGGTTGGGTTGGGTTGGGTTGGGTTDGGTTGGSIPGSDTGGGSNGIPVASNDTAETVLNTDVVIDVLANDSGLVDTPVQLTVIQPPASGTVSANADDTITYSPAAGYAGSDSFVYSVTDANGDIATATVTVNVSCTSCAIGVSIVLSWDQNLDGVTGYRVYFGASEALATQQVASVNVTDAAFDTAFPSLAFDAWNDLGLRSGDVACFRIRAFNTYGIADYSAATCGTL